MTLGGQIEGPAGQVGRLPGVGTAQDVRSPHQRGNGELVASRGAGGELGGDLHRQRPGGQQRRGYLAVQGVHSRGGLAGAHRLSVQVMGETQHLSALGEQLTADQFPDRVEQARGGHIEDRGELAHSEPASQRRGDSGDVAGGRRHAGQASAHPLAHPQRQPGLHQRGTPRIDADQVLFPQAREQLQEKERVPPRALGQGQQGIVGSGVKDVSRHLGDSGLVKTPENRLAGSVAEQFGDHAPQIAVRLDGTGGQHPADRQGSQPGRQCAYRRPGTAVSPLQVVKADQDRPAQRGLLKQGLDVFQQPVALLARGAGFPECRTFQQRLRPAEQCLHQHDQLHGRIAGSGLALTNSETILPRCGHHLLDQAGLA